MDHRLGHQQAFDLVRRWKNVPIEDEPRLRVMMQIGVEQLGSCGSKAVLEKRWIPEQNPIRIKGVMRNTTLERASYRV